MINAYALAIVAAFASAVELLAPDAYACPTHYDEFEGCRGKAKEMASEDEY